MNSIEPRPINSPAEFAEHVEKIESDPDYRQPLSFGMGLARVALSGEVLDVKFPVVNKEENFGTAAVLANATGNYEEVDKNGVFAFPERAYRHMASLFIPFDDDGQIHKNIDAMHAVFGTRSNHPERYKVKPVVSVVHELDDNPQNTVDAWFRLHMISTRKVVPHEVSLKGIFGLMTNVAWTSERPVLPDDVDMVRSELMMQDKDLVIRGTDKFPHMLDYVRPPSGVRIADATRVRLGAHLAKGTTVMHEGFVNFNAGTLPPNYSTEVDDDEERKRVMVEGRISSGVVVGDRSDIGGGASIMGTLSGGGEEVISVGEGCLLGANSGLGISLGNDCVVEAGLYVTAGTKVEFEGTTVKASELSGSSGLLFIRNSITGSVTARRREGKKSVLNSELHKN